MTFTIPVWVFWVVGIPIGVVVVGLAILGLTFISVFGKGINF